MNQKTEEESTSDSDSQKEIFSSKLGLETHTKSSVNNMTVTLITNTKLKTRTKRPNGRLGKRKTRKNVRIKGLDAIDFLHNRTLLSTASKGVGPKSPPPPGCVDYKFTALTAMAANSVPIHSELPPATYETPYALQVLLDMYREQFLAMIRCMKSDTFRKNVEIQIIEEKEKKQKLRSKLEQLNKQINQLISDSLKLLRTRMTELGITNGYNARDLMAKAKEIMSHHHELQGEAVQLNHQIPVLEGESVQFLPENMFDKYGEPPSEFKVHLSPACSEDRGQSCTEIPIQQVKSEPLEDDNDKNMSSSELQCQLNPVDCSIRTQTIEPPRAHPHTTPFSIVLPRIGDVPSSKLLTPAQKKFASNESQVIVHTRDLSTDAFLLNNENKPPSEKHDSTHRHRHKKSHKSKRKHKHHDSFNQHDLKEVKLPKVEPFSTPSYSKMITDPIEDIITRTLNDTSGNSYTTRESPAIIAPTMKYLNCGVTNGGGSDKMNQTDYRRVPPMKIALKKFAQENNYFQNSQSSSMMKTTVGDLVSSEIEKSLEISNRSTTNRSSTPSDYKTVDNRSMYKPWTKHCYDEREEKNSSGSHNQQNSKSQFLTSSYTVPSPSYSLCKTSPKIKEEPFEGLAASMFGVVNSRRPSEVDNSRYSSPYCTPPMNLEFKMGDPNNIVPDYRCSTFNSAPMLPNEPSSFTDLKDRDGDDNKWQDVSTHFDRMFEFVTNKIVSHESVPSKDKFRSKLKDSITDKQSPTFALNPPPLFRADSSFADSPPMPDLPISPASLEGPFSPVPSLSPPELSSPISTSNTESKDEHSTFNEKFRPKGKGWKWP